MYDHALHTIASVLLREKEKGKFRALGITETSPNDHEQRMLQRAVHDGVWEVVMLGFNMMHHNARTRIFPHTMAYNIGTLLMFVVRNIFSQPGRLTAKMQELAAAGQVPRWLAETDNPLGFLLYEGGASRWYARFNPRTGNYTSILYLAASQSAPPGYWEASP
jgi:hypothetical protein